MSVHGQKERDFMSSNGSVAAEAPLLREGDHAAPRVSYPDASIMSLLAQHVPLTLLADLAAPGEPPSAEILRTEGLPEQRWWA